MDFSVARQHMLDSQIRTNKVTEESILAAMAAIPREIFLPEAARSRAYLDEDVALAPGRYLMEPMVMARLVQAAEIGPEDFVLVVGAASGYAPALIAPLAGGVIGLESDPALAAIARRNLTTLGLGGIEIAIGELTAGYPQKSPYGAILIDGAIEILPPALSDQLAEGGRLVAIRREAGIGRAVRLVKGQGRLAERILFDAQVPLLPGFAAPAGFVF